uniref:Nitroreductase domain-containing protein n=1 Tax=Setaria digitata TaxID=48799 RepID=A0A915PYJ9_9BILA
MLKGDNWRWDAVHACINVLCLTVVVAFVVAQLVSLFQKIATSKRSPAVTQPDRKVIPQIRMTHKQVGDFIESAVNYREIFGVKKVPYHRLHLHDDEALLRSQLFYENMKMRRCVQEFSPRPVPSKLIQNIIKSAGTAPSAGNLQPWMFCVISNYELKAAIRKIIEEEERSTYSKKMGVEWVLDISKLQVVWSKPYLTEAPHLIVVMKQVHLNNNSNEITSAHYNQISVGITVGILIAALQVTLLYELNFNFIFGRILEDAGLATSVTYPLYGGEKIRKHLKRPIDEEVFLLLPVGFPAKNATVPDLKRKSVEEIIRCYA